MTTSVIEAHPDFASEILGNRRDITVYVPPGYEESDERYPVLYMQDGQNLFDPKTAAFGVEWEAGKTTDRLVAEGAVEPMIIVGIANTPDRFAEYSTERGAEYAEFVADELKPFIDEQYRTRPEREWTAIGGSSMGGLAAIVVCLEKPEIFGRCAAFSPSLWYAGEEFVERIEKALPNMPDLHFRILVGKNEGGGVMRKGALWLRDALRRADHPRWRYREFAETSHDEASWAKQLPLVLPELWT